MAKHKLIKVTHELNKTPDNLLRNYIEKISENDPTIKIILSDGVICEYENTKIKLVDDNYYLYVDDIPYFVDNTSGDYAISREFFNKLSTPLTTYGISDSDMQHIVNEIVAFMNFWSSEGGVEKESDEYQDTFNEMAYLVGRIHKMKSSKDFESN